MWGIYWLLLVIYDEIVTSWAFYKILLLTNEFDSYYIFTIFNVSIKIAQPSKGIYNWPKNILTLLYRERTNYLEQVSFFEPCKGCKNCWTNKQVWKTMRLPFSLSRKNFLNWACPLCPNCVLPRDPVRAIPS
jgi:hypothetical protein